MLHEGQTVPQSFSDNVLPDYRVSGGLLCKEKKMPHHEVSSWWAVNKGVHSRTVQNFFSSVFFLLSLLALVWLLFWKNELFKLPTCLFSTTTSPIVLQGQKPLVTARTDDWSPAAHFRGEPHLCVIKPGFICKPPYLWYFNYSATLEDILGAQKHHIKLFFSASVLIKTKNWKHDPDAN